MRLTEKHRKYILLGIVTFIILGILMAKILGNKQDKQFAYEDMLYANLTQMFEQGNYNDALKLSNELLKLQPKSEVVNYLGGLIAEQVGEYNQSAILLQKTMDINPHKVEDAMFMLHFGEILFLAERFEDAKVVIERTLTWRWAEKDYPGVRTRLEQMLDEIENNRTGGK